MPWPTPASRRCWSPRRPRSTHPSSRPRSRPACTSCARSRSPSTSTMPAASPPSPTTRGVVLQVGFWRRFAPPWRDGQGAHRRGRDRHAGLRPPRAVGRRPAAGLVLRSGRQRRPGHRLRRPRVRPGRVADRSPHHPRVGVGAAPGRAVRGRGRGPGQPARRAGAGRRRRRHRRPDPQRPLRRRRPHRGARLAGRAARRPPADQPHPPRGRVGRAGAARVGGGGRHGRRRGRAGPERSRPRCGARPSTCPTPRPASARARSARP